MDVIDHDRSISSTRGNLMRRSESPVVIVKGLPGHPEGAIRFVRREQRDRWEKQGICRRATESDIKTFEARRRGEEIVVKPVAKKRGRPRKS